MSNDYSLNPNQFRRAVLGKPVRAKQAKEMVAAYESAYQRQLRAWRAGQAKALAAKRKAARQ